MNPQRSARRRPVTSRRRHLASLGLAAAAATALLYLIPGPGASRTGPPETFPAAASVPAPEPAAEIAPAPEPAAEAAPASAAAPALPPRPPAPRWDARVEVRPGDTLTGILQRENLLDDAHALIGLGAPARPLFDLRPGQVLHLERGADGLEHLMHRPRDAEELHFRRTAGGYASWRVALPVETSRRLYRGAIDRHLFGAGQAAGLSDTQIMALADIFGWDIDFALEIRAGDSFRMLAEERRLDGRRIGVGPILAAEFINRGKMFRAVRHVDAAGRADYYTPEGQPLRKQFRRAPVAFTRISSRFSKRRLHPVHKVYRPHRGVDYAAPTGTPVLATGDGTVIFRGRKGGYGRTVILRHGDRFTTLYAHLSRYARGLRVGRKVRQGQRLGAVGMSGVATGPHLHYEFRVRGVHRNPLTVKLPPAAPLPAAERGRFEAGLGALLSELEHGPRTARAGG